MAGRRLGVVVLLPEPLAVHVQAWRRGLRDPGADVVAPHLTLVPPQTVADGQVPAAVELLERAASQVPPGIVVLHGAATFLPVSPVAYLQVVEGTETLARLEAALRSAPLERRTHPFHAHVTVTQDRPEAELRAAASDLAGFHASFPLREVLLLEEDATGKWLPGHRAAVGGLPTVREVAWQEAVSAGVFLLDGARVLLGLRVRGAGRRYPGMWDALGGKAEGGEPLLGALLREVREEAGVEPLDVAPLGCFHDGERADAYYLATSWRGEPHNAEPDEHARLEWVPLHQAAGLDLPPTARQALMRLLEVTGSATAAPPLAASLG